jgi:hypothetical protein
MIRRLSIALALMWLLLVAPAQAAGPVSVTLDQSHLETSVGDRFSVTSTVRNDTGHELSGLVAHLNVLSTMPQVYVDPEDWSSHRTAFLPTVPAHSTTQVDWQVQVVNEGEFVLYVAVTSTTGAAYVDVSPGLRLTSTAQRRLDAAGVLPTVLGVPAVVTVLLTLAGVRRRRLR